MRMPHWQPIISAGSYAPQRNSLPSRQPALTHKTYPDPSRPTLDDLDPTAEPLLGNLLVVWRALCDPVFFRPRNRAGYRLPVGADDRRR